MRDEGELWGLVLAAGEGRRLASVTTDEAGRVVPKQYCALAGATSLLERTQDRLAHLVERRRIVTVVAAAHATHWRSAARNAPGIPAANWIEQPQNRGTAAGVLLPLLEIARRDPSARVIMTPSDHLVGDDFALRRSLLEALSAIERPDHRIVLIGIRPDGPVGDYGWIVPSGRSTDSGAPLAVARFVEKPGADEARSLLGSGGVWNSFLLVARVRSLLALFERRAPELLDALRTAVAAGPEAVRTVYEELADLDFSRHLLAGSEGLLGLLVAPPCGWTDLGTPERLAAVTAAEHRPILRAPSSSGTGSPLVRRRLRARTVPRAATAVG